MFRKQEKTIDQFDYYPNYIYRLPAQKDRFDCGIFVGLYMVMIARNFIEYTWPADMQEFRFKLALAIENNDVNLFLEPPEI